MRNTTVLIIVKNEMKEAQLCIRSLRLFNDLKQLTVVLADVASTDGTREWAAEEKDFTCVYMEEEAGGYAAIVNRVIRELQDENDLLVLWGAYMFTPFSLANLKRLLYASELTGAVGPLCNRFEGRQCAGEMASNYKEAHMLACPMEIPEGKRALCLNAGAVLFKYEALKKTGSFDETLEEAESSVLDYGFRMILKDYELYSCKEAILWSCRRDFIREGYPGNFRRDRTALCGKWGMNYFYMKSDTGLIGLINREKEDTFTILEVGCDTGNNLLEIKNQYHNAVTYGVEINENAARLSGKITETVWGNIEDKNLPYREGMFDYIIFGNVLEHLGDPEGVVSYCRRLLKEDGRILADIPNLMHISVVEDLLKGNFTYRDTGLLDRTHIHLFTFNEIVRMFLDAGFLIEDMRHNVLDITEEQKELIEKLVAMNTGADRFMFEAFQYFVSAVKE